MTGIIPSALALLTYVILTTTLFSRYCYYHCYYPHKTDGETVAQRG